MWLFREFLVIVLLMVWVGCLVMIFLVGVFLVVLLIVWVVVGVKLVWMNSSDVKMVSVDLIIGGIFFNLF